MLWENLLATYNLASSRFCNAQHLRCKDLGSNAPSNKHSLEDQFCQLAMSTSNSGTYAITETTTVASKDKQNHHCMVARVELEANAIGHEMTNQQSEFQSFPYTTQIWIALRKLVPTYNFTASFSCSANSLLRTTFRPW